MKAEMFVVSTGAFVASAKRLCDSGELSMDDYAAILRRSKELQEVTLINPLYVKESLSNASKVRQMLVKRGIL